MEGGNRERKSGVFSRQLRDLQPLGACLSSSNGRISFKFRTIVILFCLLQVVNKTAAPAAAPVKRFNDAYLDILLDALRNIQPGQDLGSVSINTNPRMSLPELEALCQQAQFVSSFTCWLAISIVF